MKDQHCGSKMDMENLINRAVALGAAEAKIIDPKTVKTGAWVAMKCRYGCSSYGSSLCCPPNTPGYQETQAVIDSYQRALLIHCKSYRTPTEIIASLEKEAFLAGFYKAFGLGAGPCRLCKPCSLEKCCHSQSARPSMEGCGIDVYETARVNGFPIVVLTDGECEQNCFGLLLLD